MSPRLAVFDCDGTLVDGQASICEAMEAAFTEAGLPAPDRHSVRRIVGLSLPQAVRRLAPEADGRVQALAVDAYKRAYRTAREQGRIAEPLFDGIAPLLDDLRQAGWLLGVATGKSDRGLNHCLATHGLTGHFATLQTADRHPSKPHPSMMEAALAETLADPAQAVMIGDTAFDMALAVNCGVRAIGVDWGYHDRAELVAAGAEWVAETPDQLGEYLLS
ncbi:HAD hydrolase-like protein [Novosphingobium sp. TH158]|uniref:HAD hydrolase-like protein n=1 Tax=Novosphingobium sp. TH158 TaxID=2067455 RepID=UPI000C799727|nr:HAD hydrolase-like protein [Novosphingobium sp. TH158]PLK26488.1 haloacid dehalogenase [Novosphingobium sp. TH158]